MIVFVIIITAIILAAIVVPTQRTTPTGGPSVSINEITYPADINCDNCNERIDITPFTIESDTWDLKCPRCKQIGYKHPRREERKQQLDDMLNW